jgi:quinol monooxygenase YgiN
MMRRWSSIRWTVLALSLAVLVVGGGLLAGKLRAQQPAVKVPAHPSPYYVINFVDSVPNYREAAVATLKQYVADMRKEPGNQSAEALVQLNRPNHFFLYEVWESDEAFQKHEGSATTLEFRNKIQPMLGAPFDERAHYKLE